MAYTDEIQVELYLQRALTTYEKAALSIIIPALKIWIDNRLSSTFDQVDSSIRYYDGGVSSLDIDPCTSITQIEAIGDDGGDSYVYSDIYEIVTEPQNETVKREVRKRLSKFPRGIHRIAVTAQFSEYDSGVPADIQLLATRLAGGLLAQGKFVSSGGNVMQESLEGHEIRYMPNSADIMGLTVSDPTVASILANRQELYLDNYDVRNETGYDDDNEGGLLI